jgi:tRNA(Ile)-lysidine synthase
VTTHADNHRRAERRIVRAWRALTGGPEVRDADRPTLLACSGGADSTALAIALAAPSRPLVIAHVRHDLRPPAETEPERQGVRTLADRLGIPFVHAEARVSTLPGNPEANARRARYRILESLASDNRCAFVATGHHAEDQLETILMALVRGSGPRGLGAMPEQRTLGRVTLIRPMLEVSRADARAICRAANATWFEDHTNADTSRLRAAMRAGPAPALAAIRPRALARASEAAAQLRDTADLLDTLAARILDRAESLPGALRWDRPALAAEHPALLAAALRLAYARLHGGSMRDSLTARSVRQAVRAITQTAHGARTIHRDRRFQWRGTELLVTPAEVRITRSQT